ncbi:HAD family hydrolase, partial [Selenomonas sp.]|uniref:HAD family hydrolase n=1 Tax=Selenomonas sp. TaxID=2053611 RepID=UPI002A764101
LAASAEQDATHPYAKVLCAVASDRRLRLHRLSAATLVPHAGAEALLMGQTLRVGRLDWLEAEGVKTSAELATRADQLAIHGLALIGVALGPRTRGLIAFEEDVSETAKKTIADLERHGITTILCTHGGRRYANAMQKALGTTEAKSLANTDSLTRELQLRKAKGHVIASLVPSLDDAADLAIHLMEKEGASGLTIASLAALPALIVTLRSIARALRSGCRLALAGLIVLTLPAFGLLHAIGGPFLPPTAAALGLAIFTIACGFLFLAKKS